MKQKLKTELSAYNILVDLDDGFQGLLYNGVSGELIHLKNRLYHAIKEGNINKMLPGERKFFEQKGVFCADLSQQKQLLKQRFQKMKIPGDVSTFILTPTLKCNLDCHYCYETHARIERKTMSMETAERAVRFIEHEMSQSSKKTAILKFYGGEPLLATEICKFAANKIKASLKRMGKNLIIWVQTNGLLVDEEMLRALLPNLTCMEITLDGCKENHDRVRISRSQTPTYEKIIENILRLGAQDIPVLLRINAHSAAEMKAALDDLEHYGVHRIKRLFFYDGQVADSFYDHNIQGIECINHLENEEQLKIIHEIRSFVKTTHWIHKYQVFPIFQKSSGICSFAQEGNYCIDPLGHLYSCLFQISNPLYKIGNIKETGKPDFLPVYREILKRNPFNTKDCEYCGFLPQCWGGCYIKSFARTGSVSESFCGNLKRVFPYILKSTLWGKSYENIKI